MRTYFSISEFLITAQVGIELGTKARLNSKKLRKLGTRNITQYSAANVPFPAFFPPIFTSSILSAICLQEPARESKPRFGAALVRSAHERETGLYGPPCR